MMNLTTTHHTITVPLAPPEQPGTARGPDHGRSRYLGLTGCHHDDRTLFERPRVLRRLVIRRSCTASGTQ